MKEKKVVFVGQPLICSTVPKRTKNYALCLQPNQDGINVGHLILQGSQQAGKPGEPGKISEFERGQGKPGNLRKNGKNLVSGNNEGKNFGI